MGNRSVYVPVLVRDGKRVRITNQNSIRKTRPLSARKLRNERIASHDFDNGRCKRCGYELVELACPSEWVKGCR